MSAHGKNTIGVSIGTGKNLARPHPHSQPSPLLPPTLGVEALVATVLVNSLSLFLSLCVCMFLCLLFPFLVGTPTLPLRGSSKDIKANEKGSRLTLKRKKKEKGKEKEREKGKDKKEKEKEKGKEKEKEKEKPKEQEQEVPKKVEGMWLDDTQKLAAYPDLFMSEVIIFLIILLFVVLKNYFLIRTWWS